MTDAPQDVIDTVARQVAADTIIEAAELGRIEWAEYPATGQHDWNRVLARVKAIADDIQCDPALFEVAYDFLAKRAEGATND